MKFANAWEVPSAILWGEAEKWFTGLGRVHRFMEDKHGIPEAK